MAPNTGVPARDIGYDVVQCLSTSFVFGENGVVKVLGTIPANSLILKPMGGVQVTTVFNAGTSNTLNIGSTADDDLFGTLLALGALAFVPLDEAIGGFFVTSDTTITATLVLTGTAATTGAARVVIPYISF